jgi:hypothetical protein
MKLHLTTVRNIFLAVFIVAALISFSILFRESAIVVTEAGATDPGRPEASNTVVQLDLGKLVPLLASSITALTTLVGFVLTAVLNIRREKRDARESALSLKQKELDLQRALIELEELKKKVSQS